MYNNLIMKKTILLIMILISIVALAVRFWGSTLLDFFQTPNQAGIRVLSTPSEGFVFINGAQVGKIPFQDEKLKSGEIDVKISSGDLTWQGKVKLSSGTLTVVNRELAKETSSASGETLTLEKGKGITVISYPAEADLEIDGKFYGKTPISLEVTAGEHTFNLSHPGFLKRSVKAYVPDKYNLNLNVDLAASEADLTATVTPPITETPKVVVLDTPTGFLRVRDKPDLIGKEIKRVSPGDELILLEELSGWDKIRLPDDTEGYVSSTYLEKKTQ